MELIVDGGLMPRARLEPLMAEANELLAITAASRITAGSRLRRR